LFGLLTAIVQLLLHVNQLLTGIVVLRPQFSTLRAQVVDLRLALGQQLFQVGQAGLRTLPRRHRLYRLLPGLGNVQAGAGFKSPQRFAFF
jgi:hypothetical protein